MKPSRRERGQGSIGLVPGSRFYYIWFYDNSGKQHRESSKSELKSVAQELLNQRLAAMGRGERSPSDVRSIRYEDMRAILFADYQEKGISTNKIETLKDGTLNLRQTGLKFLDGFFKGMRLNQITTDVIRQYRKSRKCSETTKNRDLALLRRMIVLTVREKDLQFTLPYFVMTSEADNARQGFVTAVQFNAILTKLPEHLHALMIFLYFTGCRVGAAKRITWSMVSGDCKLVELPAGIVKNKEPLTLPLPEKLTAILRKKFRTGDVFETTNLRKEWEKAAGEILIHDLRRSAVRNLRKAGVSETVAMKISGHKTADVFRRYNIVNTEDLTDAMNAVESCNNRSIQIVSK